MQGVKCWCLGDIKENKKYLPTFCSPAMLDQSLLPLHSSVAALECSENAKSRDRRIRKYFSFFYIHKCAFNPCSGGTKNVYGIGDEMF